MLPGAASKPNGNSGSGSKPLSGNQNKSLPSASNSALKVESAKAESAPKYETGPYAKVVDIGGDCYFLEDDQTSLKMGCKSYVEFKKTFDQNLYKRPLKDIEYIFGRYLAFGKQQLDTFSGDDKDNLIYLLTTRIKQLKESSEYSSSRIINSRMRTYVDNINAILAKLGEAKEVPNNVGKAETFKDEELYQFILELTWFMTHADKVPKQNRKHWNEMIKKMQDLKLGDIANKIRLNNSANSKPPTVLNFFGKNFNMNTLKNAKTLRQAVGESDDSLLPKFDSLLALLKLKGYLDPKNSYDLSMENTLRSRLFNSTIVIPARTGVVRPPAPSRVAAPLPVAQVAAAPAAVAEAPAAPAGAPLQVAVSQSAAAPAAGNAAVAAPEADAVAAAPAPAAAAPEADAVAANAGAANAGAAAPLQVAAAPEAVAVNAGAAPLQVAAAPEAVAVNAVAVNAGAAPLQVAAPAAAANAGAAPAGAAPLQVAAPEAVAINGAPIAAAPIAAAPIAAAPIAIVAPAAAPAPLQAAPAPFRRKNKSQRGGDLTNDLTTDTLYELTAPLFDYIRVIFDPIYSILQSEFEMKIALITIIPLLHACMNIKLPGIYRIVKIDPEVKTYIDTMLGATQQFISKLPKEVNGTTLTKEQFLTHLETLPKIRLTSLLGTSTNSTHHKDTSTVQFLSLGVNFTVKEEKKAPADSTVHTKATNVLDGFFDEECLYLSNTQETSTTNKLKGVFSSSSKKIKLYTLDWNTIKASKPSLDLQNDKKEINPDTLEINPEVIFNDSELFLKMIGLIHHIFPGENTLVPIETQAGEQVAASAASGQTVAKKAEQQVASAAKSVEQQVVSSESTEQMAAKKAEQQVASAESAEESAEQPVKKSKRQRVNKSSVQSSVVPVQNEIAP